MRLEVGETKTDECRTIYLDEELKELFNQQWDAYKTDKKLTTYVFPNGDGYIQLRTSEAHGT